MELEGLRITKQLLVDFNRRQKLLGVFSLLASVGLVGFTFLFFWGVSAFAGSNFKVDALSEYAGVVSLVLTTVVVLSGYIQCRNGHGGSDYWNSVHSYLPNKDTTGAIVVGHYVSQVTGPAFAVSQLILAGPRYFLQGLEKLTFEIEESESMSRTMERVRATLDQERMFHPVARFANEIDALRNLGRMGIATLAPRDDQLKVRISLDAQSKRS